MTRVSLEDEREALEKQAALAKARLLTALDALDRRRRDALSPAAHIQRHPYAAVVVSGSAVLMLGSAVALGVYAARRREARLPQERWAALVRMWNHPERAGKPARGSLVAAIGRKVLIGLAGVAVMEPTKRVVKLVVARMLESTAQQLSAQTVNLLTPGAPEILVVARPSEGAYAPIPRETLTRGLAEAPPSPWSTARPRPSRPRPSRPRPTRAAASAASTFLAKRRRRLVSRR